MLEKKIDLTVSYSLHCSSSWNWTQPEDCAKDAVCPVRPAVSSSPRPLASGHTAGWDKLSFFRERHCGTGDNSSFLMTINAWTNLDKDAHRSSFCGTAVVHSNQKSIVNCSLRQAFQSCSHCRGRRWQKRHPETRPHLAKPWVMSFKASKVPCSIYSETDHTKEPFCCNLGLFLFTFQGMTMLLFA